MIDQAEVVVVGAGALGSATAYHLARLGKRDVALLDKFELGSQTSPRAAGQARTIRATPNLTRLALRAVEQLLSFTRDTGQPLRLDQTGALQFARTEADEAQLRDEVARCRALGLPADFVTPSQAADLLPILEWKGIRAAAYNPTDLNIEPSQLPIGYCRAAETLGVTTLPNTAVTGIEVGPNGVSKVYTEKGEIRTEVVVDAAGAWSRLVADLAGVYLPVVPTRHQLLITEPIEGVTSHFPIARVMDTNVYLRHERGGLLMGGYEQDPRMYAMGELPPDFQISDLELDIEVLRRLADTVRDQFPIFQDPSIRIAEHRGGLPTMTTDDRYLVGPVSGVRGLWVITGCCVGGLSTSPALGEAVAQWIIAGQPELDLSELSLDRFATQRLDEEELRARCRHAYANYYRMAGGVRG